MFIKLIRLCLIAVLSAAILNAPSQTRAEDPPAGTEKAQKAARPKQFPFRGKIGSVDQEKNWVILAGKTKNRTIQITPQTRIMKAGKPAKLADAVVGEEVGGLVVRTEDGKEEAVSLRLGPKPESGGSNPEGEE